MPAVSKRATSQTADFASALRSPPTRSQCMRVLIVDDEPLACERIRTLLNSEPDIEIAGECHDGRSAVEAIRGATPDLVFLDVQMPEMDGFAVLQALDRMPAVIFVTAYDQFALRAFEVHA